MVSLRSGGRKCESNPQTEFPIDALFGICLARYVADISYPAPTSTDSPRTSETLSSFLFPALIFLHLAEFAGPGAESRWMPAAARDIVRAIRDTQTGIPTSFSSSGTAISGRH